MAQNNPENSSSTPYQHRAGTQDEFNCLPIPGNAETVRQLIEETQEYLATQESIRKESEGGRLKRIARGLGKLMTAQGYGMW